jgi:hypothetical protein
MRRRFTSRMILDIVGCVHLKLDRGKDCWILIYDDREAGISDTRSVTVRNLSDWTLKKWIDETRAYVAYVNAKWKVAHDQPDRDR